MARGDNDQSNKVVKVRKGHRDDVVSFGDHGQRKGANSQGRHQGLVKNAMVSAMFNRRSVIAEERGYARGPMTERGVGRNTGITSVNVPSARADLEKRPSLGRGKPFGYTRMPGDGI